MCDVRHAVSRAPGATGDPRPVHGWCGLCETPILAGEEMIVKVDGDWVHATCADAEGHEVML